jgi:hypothetical protein
MNYTSIVIYIFGAAETCLPSRCLAMNFYPGSAIPGFMRHVTAVIRTFGFAADRFHSSLIERGSVAVKLQINARISARTVVILAEDFSWFSSVRQRKCRNAISIRPLSLPS